MIAINSKSNFEINKFLIAILVVVLFSADKQLLLMHYIIGRGNVSILTVGSIFIILSFLFFIAMRKGVVQISTRHKNLMYFSLFFGLYFLLHELIFRDGLVSAKYAVFLLIISLSFWITYNFFYIFKVLGYVGGFICFIIILQQILLLVFAGGDLSQYEITIAGKLYNRWMQCDFVTPYGLGMFEVCSGDSNISIFGYGINRSLFFSTEPKYISSILLVTFGSLLISRSRSFYKYGCLAAHLLAVALIGSASAVLVLMVSFLLVFFRYLGAFSYALGVFLMPIFVLPILFEGLLQLAGVDGYVAARIFSGASSTGLAGIPEMTMLGEGFHECSDKICRDSKGLLGSLYGTYGLIGFFFFWVFMLKVITPMFEYIGCASTPRQAQICFGFLIFLNTYIVFNVYFFGDLFNTFGLLIILSLIFLPQYLSKTEESMPYSSGRN
jgi:hypothetical protein